MEKQASNETETPKPTEDVPMGEAMEMYGVFDADDLSDDFPEPVATFRSKGDADGYVLLACQGCMDPVVRPCKVSGTVNVEKG